MVTMIKRSFWDS